MVFVAMSVVVVVTMSIVLALGSRVLYLLILLSVFELMHIAMVVLFLILMSLVEHNSFEIESHVFSALLLLAMEAVLSDATLFL